MSWKPFARVLMRKSERALASARRNLTDQDYDSAVNRAYYAMFDVARAAALRAGVSEDKLPRTHSGVIHMFREHAVKSGLMDQQLAGELSRTEALRIKADYTDLEVDSRVASEVVDKAALFVRAVERVFYLDDSSLTAEDKNEVSDRAATDSETAIDSDKGGGTILENRSASMEPISLEDIRREARANWLRLRQQKIEGKKDADHHNGSQIDAKNDKIDSLDGDFDE